jgi:serine/threonine protein kinase
MSNGARAAGSARATYQVLRELGRRSQRSHAAVSSDGEAVVVVTSFVRDPLWSSEVEAPSGHISPEAMAVVVRDARCLAQNWHPNIAHVRHVDRNHHDLTIATDLVDGVTLEELHELASGRSKSGSDAIASSGALSPEILLRIFVDVLAGLQALHGLRDAINAPLFPFHGELGPANVIVGRDGVTRLVNVFRPRPVALTSKSESVRYGAPETLGGDGEQDVRVDVYSTGAMLWEALTGRRLFGETQPACILKRQREEELPRPDGPLGEIAMRALAFDPSLRFPTAEAMAARLREASPTIAPASAVAHRVMELAGDRIRARRAELEPDGSGQRRAIRSEPRLEDVGRMVDATAPASPALALMDASASAVNDASATRSNPPPLPARSSRPAVDAAARLTPAPSLNEQPPFYAWPTRREPSTRTPFEIDISRPRREPAPQLVAPNRIVPLVAAIASVALLALLIGAAIISQAHTREKTGARATAPSLPEPPSTVIVAPPPPADVIELPASDAVPAAPATSVSGRSSVTPRPLPKRSAEPSSM